MKIRLFKRSSANLIRQIFEVTQSYWKVEDALVKILGQSDSSMPLRYEFKASDMIKRARHLNNRALYVLPKFGPDCMVIVVALDTKDLNEKLSDVLEYARSNGDK